MADETVPATTQEAPKPEQPVEGQPTPDATPAPDPRDAELARLRDQTQRSTAAYNDLQRKYQMQFDRNNASTALMTEMAESVRLLRESQNAIAKSTLGEEQAKALDDRITASGQESQRRQAAQSAMQFIEAQTRLFTESLQAAGVDTSTIAWPTDAGSVTEWHERAKEQVFKAITTTREKYVKAVESASAKAKEAAKVEAEKIADKSLREAGVGRVDSTKGVSTSMRDRINALSPTSPEFQELIKQAKRGDLTKI